jgi:hypothetical protein
MSDLAVAAVLAASAGVFAAYLWLCARLAR